MNAKKKKNIRYNKTSECLGGFCSNRGIWQISTSVLMCHHINGNCLYINWLRLHCRITTRLPCCALTFRSFKTDTAFCFLFSFFFLFAWLTLKNVAFVKTERLLCWHLWCSSTARSDSCSKTDIYVVTLGFFNWNDTERPLSTERISSIQ